MTSLMRCTIATMFVLYSAAAAAQPAAPEMPMLSPQAAYEQANEPVDITHRSKENWSEIEKASLDVAVSQAKEACLARQSLSFAGDDLISYARLCDLGEEWSILLTAASAYIEAADPAKPHLDQAYAFKVIAQLHTQQRADAVTTCIAMLHAVPYRQLSESITTSTVRYLQFAYLPDALHLLRQRQPYVLEEIRSAGGTANGATEGQSGDAQAIPLHMLVEDALELPELLQFDGEPVLAAEVLADMDSAMPTAVPADEAIYIAGYRRRYDLLGKHFPEMPGAASLLSAAAPQRIKFGSATIFLLFPPWCAQCIRQEGDLAAAISRNRVRGVEMYGLLADTMTPLDVLPAPKPAVRRATTAARKAPGPVDVPAEQIVNVTLSAAKQLRGTPTLVVDPSTLAKFNALDFPFLVAVDHDGLIRLIVGAAPENSLVNRGPVDQILDTILALWPAHKAGPPANGK